MQPLTRGAVRRPFRRIQTLFMVVGILALSSPSHLHGTGSRQLLSPAAILITEAGLRDAALLSPDPLYPEASQRNGVGRVAVAVVLVDASDGSVQTVSVLEAPDTRIAAAVQKAVAEWVFAFARRLTDSEYDVEGRLTFYFELADGRVLSPAQKAQSRALSRVRAK